MHTFVHTDDDDDEEEEEEVDDNYNENNGVHTLADLKFVKIFTRPNFRV